MWEKRNFQDRARGRGPAAPRQKKGKDRGTLAYTNS